MIKSNLSQKEKQERKKQPVNPYANLEPHPSCDFFPKMNNTEHLGLRLDIGRNGLNNQIYIHENKILDGRSRYKALIEIGVELKEEHFIQYTGRVEDIPQFIISQNLMRRHFTKGQLACYAIFFYNQLKDEAREQLRTKISNIRKGKENPESEETDSNKQAGDIFGVSGRYIREAEKLMAAEEELFNKVKNGDISLYSALKRANLITKTKILHTSGIEDEDLDGLIQPDPKPENKSSKRPIRVEEALYKKMQSVAKVQKMGIGSLIEKLFKSTYPDS